MRQNHVCALSALKGRGKKKKRKKKQIKTHSRKHYKHTKMHCSVYGIPIAGDPSPATEVRLDRNRGKGKHQGAGAAWGCLTGCWVAGIGCRLPGESSVCPARESRAPLPRGALTWHFIMLRICSRLPLALGISLCRHLSLAGNSQVICSLGFPSPSIQPVAEEHFLKFLERKKMIGIPILSKVLTIQK